MSLLLATLGPPPSPDPYLPPRRSIGAILIAWLPVDPAAQVGPRRTLPASPVVAADLLRARVVAFTFDAEQSPHQRPRRTLFPHAEPPPIRGRSGPPLWAAEEPAQLRRAMFPPLEQIPHGRPVPMAYAEAWEALQRVARVVFPHAEPPPLRGPRQWLTWSPEEHAQAVRVVFPQPVPIPRGRAHRAPWEIEAWDVPSRPRHTPSVDPPPGSLRRDAWTPVDEHARALDRLRFPFVPPAVADSVPRGRPPLLWVDDAPVLPRWMLARALVPGAAPAPVATVFDVLLLSRIMVGGSRSELRATVADAVGDLEYVSLTAGHTALDVPAGATVLWFRVASGSASLTIKGTAGDTGVAMGALTASSPGVVVPLSSATVVLHSSGSIVLSVVWV